MSTLEPMHCKTFLNKDVGKMSIEQEGTFIIPISFASSSKVTDVKLLKITGEAGVGAINRDAEEVILFLTFLGFSH